MFIGTFKIKKHDVKPVLHVAEPDRGVQEYDYGLLSKQRSQHCLSDQEERNLLELYMPDSEIEPFSFLPVKEITISPQRISNKFSGLVRSPRRT